MKQGSIFQEQWAEAFSLFFVVVGFFVAIGLRNFLFSYITVLLSGALAARIFYQKRYKEPILPFILIIVGFLFGYLLGGFWVSRFWSVCFFVVGFVVSSILHRKKIFVMFKSPGFIK